MHHRLVLYVAILFAVGCGYHSRPVNGPSFDVRITLSKSAYSQLKLLGENIVVTAYFDGNSWYKPFHAGGPFRAVFLGKKDVEVGLDEVAHFRGITFPGKEFADLTWNRFYVTINVVSARHATLNNLLNCNVLQGLSSEFTNQLIEVRCTLIRPVTPSN